MTVVRISIARAGFFSHCLQIITTLRHFLENILLYNFLLYNMFLYDVLLYNIFLYNISRTAFYCTAFYCTAMLPHHSTVQHF